MAHAEVQGRGPRRGGPADRAFLDEGRKPHGVSVDWEEALYYVSELNGRRAFGLAGWRLPNRRELRSILCHQATRPALPEGHPFTNIFPGWYWSSTTLARNPAFAWYAHMHGGRMFFGEKRQYFLVWPVLGVGAGVLARTGQALCHAGDGSPVRCEGTWQDGGLLLGSQWPKPRFERQGEEVRDLLTGLVWMRRADLVGRMLRWQEALDLARKPGGRWRLPNINEPESLVDAGRYAPALPEGHLFEDVREGYWSSTTSMYGPDWAWALYLVDGGVGVGQKKGAHFHAWAVKDP